MVTTLPGRSLPQFATGSGTVEVTLGDAAWFAVGQVVTLAGGSGPAKLTITGPLDMRAFDLVLQALKAVSSANFAPEVSPPDFGGRIWPEHDSAQIWWRSSKVKDRMVSITLWFGNESAKLEWSTGTGQPSRHIQQIFSGVRPEDLL